MPRLNPTLRAEYQHLYDTATIREEYRQTAVQLTTEILSHRPSYADIESQLGIPWYVVGLIHAMESAAPLSMAGHLHNGDPLSARTVRVPANRPRQGTPPFSWEVSARDALCYRELHLWRDWSLPGILFQLELYNGWGYRTHHPEVLSPYLWSFTNHYSRGKYIRDGRFSPTAQSRQCGAAALLRCLEAQDALKISPGNAPQIRYKNGAAPQVEALQRFLNQCPGITIAVDGIPGPASSMALHQVLGCHLKGDPRQGTDPYVNEP